ncbi:hypothetical protein BDV93DRAFT_471933 [Ceratobasidium sp. AG-I]|nr:hypothetical protein BDV93DRAFT_471933 [Ceratobasidium sp. AG-I]
MSHPSPSPTHYIPRTRATHQSLHIRSAHDAHVIFEAVRQMWLPMVTHRLSLVDCNLLGPGQVFCWEQENGESGIERWTDGRKWSASRARENFLFYIENPSTPPPSSHSATSSQATSDGDRRSRAAWDFRSDEGISGFTKQTYSAWVTLDPSLAPRRWNITAYFMGGDYTDLPTIDDDPILSRVVVPSNMYATVQSLLKKSERRSVVQGDIYGTTTHADGSQNRSYHGQQIPTLVPVDQTLPRNVASTPQEVDPTVYGYPNVSNSMEQMQGSARPPLPRSAEDQRALSALRVQL